MVKILFGYVVIVSCAAQLCAQETTGNLEGWVLGSNNEPLPNANISVHSPSLQGSRGTSSNEHGYFRVVALPVGRYTVEVTHVAYATLTFENVRIELGRTTTIGRAKLQSRTVELSTVTVSADRRTIDPTTSTTGLNLSYDEIVALPVDRDYLSIVTLTPGANASFYGDRINISGSTGTENVYYIDGVNVTDPYFALGSVSLPYNFVKEIEVKTGGYEAEYGSALGGVINAITHSGGNQVSGRLFGFLTNNRFGGERRSGVVASSVKGFSLYDVGFSLGGPLAYDNLRFLASYNPTFEIENIEIPGLGSYEDKRVSHKFAGKLTWNASDRTSVVFGIIGDPMRNDIVGELGFAQQNTVENEDAFLLLSEGGGINASLNAKTVITERFLIEVNMARMEAKSSSQGATARGRTEPLFVDLETGSTSGGIGYHGSVISIRTSVSAKASLLFGRHTVKAGIEYELNSSELNNYSTGPGNTVGGPGLIYRINDSLFQAFTDLTRGQVRNHIPALFVQDGWQVNPRLLLQVGLRWSGEYLIGSDGRLAQTIDDEFQPRVGFVFQPGDLGSQKIFGSYGRFYEKIPTAFSGFYHVNKRSFMIAYEQNPFDSPSGGDTLVNGSSSILGPITGLGGQYFDEFSLGYQCEVSDRLRLGIHGIYRTLRRVIEDFYNPELGKFVVGNPGKGELSLAPDPTRKYMALEISLQKTATTGLSYFFAYTLSRNYGNYDGLFSQDYGGGAPNATPIFDHTEQFPNSTGLLPNDRTHVLKLSAVYRFDFGLNVGSAFIWQSGTPLNNFGATSVGFLYNSFLQKRGSVGRTPMTWDLSIRISYDVRMFSSAIDTKIILDFLHNGNPRKAVAFDQIHYWALDENGNQTQENPSFMSPTRFQSPMTFRMGVEVGF